MKPTSLTSCLRVSAAKPPNTLVHQAFGFSVKAALALSIAIVGAAASAPNASAQTVTYTGTGAVNFGTANVCPPGKTTPSPCSQTLTLTYNVTESGTLGTPQALTTGQPNLDYKLASGTTCTGSVTQGNTCKVNVTFAPTVPGQRNGAVEILNSSGDVLATTYIYGMGVGPLASFGPAPTRTIVTLDGYGAYGKALADANGNLFFIDIDQYQLGELVAVNGSVPDNPVTKYFSSSLSGPLALDGAGNVFTSTFSSTPPSIVEVFAASGYTTSKTIGSVVSGNVVGIAVDGSDNVFLLEGDQSTNSVQTVKELLAASGYATVKTLGGGFAFGNLTDLALDTNGNLFVTDAGVKDGAFYGAVEELPAAGGYSTVKTIHVSNAQYYDPSSIAIDAANNLFVTLQGGYGEFLAIDGVVSPSPTALYFPNNGSGYDYYALSLDQHGNLYSTNDNVFYYPTTDQKSEDDSPYWLGVIQEVSLSTPPALSFAATEVGHTSSDSPQSVQVQNQGNAALDLTGLSLDNSNWDLVKGSGTFEDCASNTSLASGAVCNISISFKPDDAGQFSGAVTLTDNFLNAPGSTQVIPLSGAGVIPYITSLNYTYGAPYSVIYVYGYNFNANKSSNAVTFNGIAAPVYYATSTFILTTVPGNATTGNLVVTVNGQPSNPVPFTVVPQPTIFSISPTSGPVGTYVIFTGTNLEDLANKGTVTFNGKPIPATFPDSTELYVQIPTGAVTGQFHLVVNDTGINSPTFTVTK